MERVRCEGELEENFSNYKLERHFSMIRLHGNMKQRSAFELWRWFAILMKKINGFIKYFKCDSVNVVSACRPLRQSWIKLEQRRRTRKRGLDSHIKHTESDLSSSSEDFDTTTNLSSKCRTPRQGSNKGWVKRLIIRGVHGIRTNKRTTECERGEGIRREKLTRKRRRIGRGHSLKQQLYQKDEKEGGLRAFLRPEEGFTTAGDSDSDVARQRPDDAITTPSQYEAFLIESPSSSSYDHDNDADDHRHSHAQQHRDTEQFRRCSRQQIPSPPAAEEEESTKLTPILPDELVDKVLSRLPLISILRFRSVCRKWHSRLSPGGWNKIFFHHQSQQGSSLSSATASAAAAASRPPCVPPPTWAACPALFTSGNGRKQCAFYDLSMHEWSSISLDFLPDSACHLLAASCGLLCLCYSGPNSSLYLCNPLTKSWRLLPSFNNSRRRAGSMIVHLLVHPESGSYKVILIGHPTCMTAAATATGPGLTEVYDSETGSWTELANIPSDGSRLAPSSVILRNGVLYCLTELPTGLLAFNLIRKVWRRLEIKSQFRVLFIFEHQGRILLVARTLGARITTRLGIWGLGERSFPKVWLKVAVMPSEHAAYFLKSGRFQCFGHGNVICFASPRKPDWLLFDLGKRVWTWGLPARGLDRDSYNRWFYYEPRLDIQP